MLTERKAVCLLCLTALMPLTVTLQQCTRDGLIYINNIIEQAFQWGGDTLLYTPTPEDFEKCPNSTLICLTKEVKVLFGEWDVKTRNDKTRHSLVKILLYQVRSYEEDSQQQQQQQECSSCETFQEQNTTHFLNFIKSTLQKINSKTCST